MIFIDGVSPARRLRDFSAGRRLARSSVTVDFRIAGSALAVVTLAAHTLEAQPQALQASLSTALAEAVVDLGGASLAVLGVTVDEGVERIWSDFSGPVPPSSPTTTLTTTSSAAFLVGSGGQQPGGSTPAGVALPVGLTTGGVGLCVLALLGWTCRRIQLKQR